MQRDVALGRVDAVLVFAGLIVGIGRHYEGFTRPFGVRMLSVDFLEFLDRFPRILLCVEEIEALVVEPVSGLIRRRVILFRKKIKAAAGRDTSGQEGDHQDARQAHPAHSFWLRGHACAVPRRRDIIGFSDPHSSTRNASLPPKTVFTETANRAGLPENMRSRHASKPTFGPD